MHAYTPAKNNTKLKKTCIHHDYETSRNPGEIDLTMDFIKIRISFNKMINGEASISDFNRIIVSIILAKIHVLSIDGILANILESAQEAMLRCKQNFNKNGFFTFNSLDCNAIISSLELNEKIITDSTPKQMANALDIFRNSINQSSQTEKSIANYIIWR